MQTHPAVRRWFQRHYDLNQEANASLLTFAAHVFPLRIPPRLASDGVDPAPLSNHIDSPGSEPWTTSTFASVQGTPTEIPGYPYRGGEKVWGDMVRDKPHTCKATAVVFTALWANQKKWLHF